MADAKHKSEHEKHEKPDPSVNEAMQEIFGYEPQHPGSLHPEHHTETHTPEHTGSSSLETLAAKVKHLETRLKEIEERVSKSAHGMEKQVHKDVEHAVDEHTARQEGRPIVG